MKHLFIPYELAVIAKEKGFDEYCFGFYNCISMSTLGIHTLKYFESDNLYNTTLFHPAQVCAPLYQQIIDWLELNHGFYFERLMNDNDDKYILWLNKNMEYSELKSLNKAIEEAFKLI